MDHVKAGIMATIFQFKCLSPILSIFVKYNQRILNHGHEKKHCTRLIGAIELGEGKATANLKSERNNFRTFELSIVPCVSYVFIGFSFFQSRFGASTWWKLVRLWAPLQLCRFATNSGLGSWREIENVKPHVTRTKKLVAQAQVSQLHLSVMINYPQKCTQKITQKTLLPQTRPGRNVKMSRIRRPGSCVSGTKSTCAANQIPTVSNES